MRPVDVFLVFGLLNARTEDFPAFYMGRDTFLIPIS